VPCAATRIRQLGVVLVGISSPLSLRFGGYRDVGFEAEPEEPRPIQSRPVPLTPRPSAGPAPSARVTSLPDDLADQLGDLADGVVLLGPADVEGLVVDQLAGRIEDGQEGVGDVEHVD